MHPRSSSFCSAAPASVHRAGALRPSPLVELHETTTSAGQFFMISESNEGDEGRWAHRLPALAQLTSAS
jgi:hypothetical protein